MVKFFFFVFKEHSLSPRHLPWLQKSGNVNFHSTYYLHWPLSQNRFSQVEGRYFARIIYYTASSTREINWTEYEHHPRIVALLSLTHVRCKIVYNILYLGEQPSTYLMIFNVGNQQGLECLRKTCETHPQEQPSMKIQACLFREKLIKN